MDNSGSLDEHQIFLKGPVVVFKWKNEQDWPVEYVSANVEENLGYPKEDLLSGRIKYADFIFKEDLPRVAAEVATYSLSDRKVFAQEYRLVKPGGDVIWIYDHTTVVRNKEGGITHFHGYIWDITRQKQNEEMLREVEKLKTVGEFAAGMVHEIKNPLTSLKGFLQLIQKETTVNQEYVTIMQSEIGRIEQILNELLITSKPQPGKFEKTDIRTLLQQVCALFDMQKIYENIQIECEAAQSGLIVFCDANHLKQVFVNLLKNAMESMPKGGKVHLSCKRAGSQIVVSIKDEGIGMSKQQLQSIGTPFFTTKKNGNGLGLMVSFDIIEKHSGTIDIQSKQNEGSCFQVSLPAAE